MTALTLLRPIRHQHSISMRAERVGIAGYSASSLGSVGCLLSILVLGLGGCKDLTGSQPLPAGTVNPSSYNTPAGAMGMRLQALNDLQQALPRHIVATGLLTDELQSNAIDASAGVLLSTTPSNEDALDARVLPAESYDGQGNALIDYDYKALQRVRTELSQVQEAIAVYDTGAKAVGDPKVLRAELFALQGYTEILLADFFCSGVPLSTLDFQRDYTYHASSTTAQVYQDAIAKEDSALALADTSTRVQYLARVLKGRALLDTGNMTAAAQVVATVPDGFQYQLAVNFQNQSSGSGLTIQWNTLNSTATVADTEGRNGLPYLSSRDPRSAAIVTHPVGVGGGLISFSNTVPLTFPVKYQYADSSSGFSPFVVASGVDARLIEAEAALRNGSNSWLTTLNQLRTSGVYTPPDTLFDTLGVTDCGSNGYGLCGSSPGGNTPAFGQPQTGFPASAEYALAGGDTVYPAPAGIQNYCNNNSWYQPCYSGDTMVVLLYVRPAGWAAGTGGMSNLAPLTDPGTDSARVALLFRERAFWLFLTGERQGDLRRLLRQYPQWFRSQAQVYPTGRYTAPGSSVYGTAVTAPIPGTEYLNPLFHGCIDRNP